MVLGCVIGKLGSGKTLYMTIECYFYRLKRDYNIFTNYTLKGIPYMKLSQPEELIVIGLNDDYDKKFAAIDEGYLWFDALEKSSSKQKFYRNLINITRKMNYHIVFTTQTMGQIYYRARLLFDYLVKPIYNKRGDYLKVTLFQQNVMGQYIPSKPYKIHKVSRFFNYFDTNEILNDFIDDFIVDGKKK